MSVPDETAPSFTVLVYATDAAVRERVRMALGRRPAPDLGRLSYVEVDTGEAVVAAVDEGDVDLCVLDAEAWPTGGLGISRQLKNEITDCPAMVVLVARADDIWLGTWSEADAVLHHPIDPVETTATVVDLLRTRAGLSPATRSDGG